MAQHQPSIEHEYYDQKSTLQEAHVARQVLAGDQDAFVYFVQCYSTPLYSYMCRVLNDTEAAADMVQDVFIRLYTYLPQMNVEKPFKPWLFQVAHNCCMDELRRQKRQKAQPFSTFVTKDEEIIIPSILDIEDSRENIEEIYARHDMQSTLQRIIIQLPLKTRAVVMLRYTSNMTFSQIGQILHMPEQTAKTYFNRARKVLQRALIQEGIVKCHM